MQYKSINFENIKTYKTCNKILFVFIGNKFNLGYMDVMGYFIKDFAETDRNEQRQFGSTLLDSAD